ncbi:peptidoglycan-binding protein [Spongiactinospora sp. TRM90649]|uniref:peptidoglycan-binding protein n=1 Tax=Spongiactinospora sp. TRM90649 TaxID=3031114 RepID=UPI0023F9F29E|nr:peptidoglycan-binding protein [Spongiactinospora sp. TRM90649]MDF5757524.1 peptidoglycan-binding protein [Spongiactinospora sp. TRM90649]
MRRSITTAAVLLAALGGGAVTAWLWNGPAATPAVNAAALPTAAVVRTDLADRTEVDGTLGYAGSHTVTADARGRITRLPKEGAVIRRGRAVFDVDGEHVPLFYGSAPLWRSLSLGVAKGADVEILKRNLKALGHGDGMTIDRSFDWRLRDAVLSWQRDLGVPRTGLVAPGDVVVLPGAIRVAKLRTSPGAPAAGVVLTATGTARQVEVKVPVSAQHLVERKDRVTVRLPGEVKTTGRVVSVGSVATATSTSQTGEGTESATVTVRIVLDRPRAAGRLDGAPVTVGFAAKVRRNVLAVPVGALLATPGGGYRVKVVDAGGGVRDVPVELGIFAEGKVEVEGDLTEGANVQVPKP